MIYQGRITRIDTDNQVWAEIADLAVAQEFPCRVVSTAIALGDDVLVVHIIGAQEDLVIIGKIHAVLGS